jgi:phosphoinositide-3-kinase regulatory subunit 4
MGNTTSTGTNYLSDLTEFQYEKRFDNLLLIISLSNARFLKTIQCRHKGGVYVVKAYIKPQASESPINIKPENLDVYVKQLEAERDLSHDSPNILPFMRIIETDKFGYLIRQFMHSSLYDRMSTRPFLDPMERRWITFQVMKGLAAAHALGVCYEFIIME